MSSEGPEDELGRRLLAERRAPAMHLAADLRRSVVVAAEQVPSRPEDLWLRVGVLTALGLALLALAALLS